MTPRDGLLLALHCAMTLGLGDSFAFRLDRLATLFPPDTQRDSLTHCRDALTCHRGSWAVCADHTTGYVRITRLATRAATKESL